MEEILQHEATRRASSRWTKRQSCTNNQTVPFSRSGQELQILSTTLAIFIDATIAAKNLFVNLLQSSGMKHICLSPLELDPDQKLRRNPPRPPHLRQVDYEEKFEYLTVFYDCFRSADGDWVLLLGPPLLNLEHIVFPAIPTLFNCSEPSKMHFSPSSGPERRNPSARIWLATSVNRVVLPKGVFQQRKIIVQPNEAELFQNRKVLLTLSNDNDLIWIRDWVSFYARMHGCDAVLFYDNSSTRYTTSEIYHTISTVPGIEATVVVSWPYKWGPAGGDPEDPPPRMPWDSNYAQLGLLEHARHRFLSRAAGVVNADVDELVITKNKDSIYDLVRTSETGYLRYEGRWIEPVTESRKEKFRHSDFEHRLASSKRISPPKWSVVPSRCPSEADWSTHKISGMESDQLSCLVSFRHFWAIGTSWNCSRGNTSRPNDQDHIKDEEIVDWMRVLKIPARPSLGRGSSTQTEITRSRSARAYPQDCNPRRAVAENFQVNELENYATDKMVEKFSHKNALILVILLPNVYDF